MRTEQVHYECKAHYEALVFSAALQLLELFELPTPRDDRDMYEEHSKHWPMPERSLRTPSGIRGKGFDGLTHGMREYLKYGHGAEGPEEILFGLQVLAWWHREIWNNSRKHAEHKSFGEHMSWHLSTGRHRGTLSEERGAVLKKLYGVEEEKVAGTPARAASGVPEEIGVPLNLA